MSGSVQHRDRAAIRLAGEGVPVAAIARGLGEPSSKVWDALREARDRGELIDLPPADWPPGSARSARASPIRLPRPDEARLAIALGQAFGLSAQQGRFLAALTLRRQATSQALKDAIRTQGEDDVLKTVACFVRAKLKPHGIEFQTVIGLGYAIGGDAARRVLAAAFGGVDHAAGAEVVS